MLGRHRASTPWRSNSALLRCSRPAASTRQESPQDRDDAPATDRMGGTGPRVMTLDKGDEGQSWPAHATWASRSLKPGSQDGQGDEGGKLHHRRARLGLVRRRPRPRADEEGRHRRGLAARHHRGGIAVAGAAAPTRWAWLPSRCPAPAESTGHDALICGVVTRCSACRGALIAATSSASAGQLRVMGAGAIYLRSLTGMLGAQDGARGHAAPIQGAAAGAGGRPAGTRAPRGGESTGGRAV